MQRLHGPYSDAAAARRLFRCWAYSATWRLSCLPINRCGDPDLNWQKQLAMDLV
jgi:hypothetical protein